MHLSMQCNSQHINDLYACGTDLNNGSHYESGSIFQTHEPHTKLQAPHRVWDSHKSPHRDSYPTSFTTNNNIRCMNESMCHHNNSTTINGITSNHMIFVQQPYGSLHIETAYLNSTCYHYMYNNSSHNHINIITGIKNFCNTTHTK